MRSECVSCVPRVFLHAIVVYVACGTEILDVLDIKIHDTNSLRMHVEIRDAHSRSHGSLFLKNSLK